VDSSIPVAKVPKKLIPKVRRDVQINSEKVLMSFDKLKKELGRKPTRLEVSKDTNLSNKKVGQYFKRLGL